MSNPLLQLRNLTITFKSGKDNFNIIDDVSFYINETEVLGIVGESGSGKSITALSILSLLPKGISITKGNIAFNGIDTLSLRKEEITNLRGKDISMIFQEPMTSLNPVYTIGAQISECLLLHSNISRSAAKEETLKVMVKVGLTNPEELYSNYPHQLSGGMRQRVMIAMAIICKPKLIIADEPTTALDVTIQAQILELLKKINKDSNTAILFISHDLGVVRNICNRVAVMYAGSIVEEASAEEIFKNPLHPYTKGLIESIPSKGKKGFPLFSIQGNVPPIGETDSNSCPFASRCLSAKELCSVKTPKLVEINSGHKVRCFLNDEKE